MKNGSSTFAHFIEFIDATDTIIRQDQRTAVWRNFKIIPCISVFVLRLQDELTGFRIFADVGRQTHSTGAFAVGVLSTWDQPIDVLL